MTEGGQEDLFSFFNNVFYSGKKSMQFYKGKTQKKYTLK